MKLLLINPKFPESFWSFSWALENILQDKKTLMSPLGLATLAALTPSHWEIRIIDENVEAIDWDFKADVVGVCGMGVQFLRQKEILQRFRELGTYVIAGGSYASLCPEDYSEIADTVISGEAERIWPEFCSDFENGAPQSLYSEKGEIDLSLSPVPRYDLIQTHLYSYVCLQFSRGCPFLCEFCDIIVMFGRKPRTKTLQQVERELDLLRELGITNVFFVDDNLIGHIPRCRELLAFLNEYQKRHNYRFTFGTEASLNLASDSALLNGMKRANFDWVFMGIESPSQEALLETRKEQNTRQDLLQSIRTIYSHGIDVYAAFIVGFDADDETIFERQFRFIMDSGIILSAVGLLMAIPNTPLYARLERENRLRSSQEFRELENQFATTNVIPLRMTFDQLLSGFRKLQSRLIEEEAIHQRIRNKLQFLLNGTVPFQLSRRRIVQYAWRFFVHGLLPGGWRRWTYFAKSLLAAWKNSAAPSLVLVNWTYALSFQRFCKNFVLIDRAKSQTELPFPA